MSGRSIRLHLPLGEKGELVAVHTLSCCLSTGWRYQYKIRWWSTATSESVLGTAASQLSCCCVGKGLKLEEDLIKPNPTKSVHRAHVWRAQETHRNIERLRTWKLEWLGACRKCDGFGVKAPMKCWTVKNYGYHTDSTRIPSRRQAWFLFSWAAFSFATGEVCPRAVSSRCKPCFLSSRRGGHGWNDLHPRPTRLYRKSYANKKTQNI